MEEVTSFCMVSVLKYSSRFFLPQADRMSIMDRARQMVRVRERMRFFAVFML